METNNSNIQSYNDLLRKLSQFFIKLFQIIPRFVLIYLWMTRSNTDLSLAPNWYLYLSVPFKKLYSDRSISTFNISIDLILFFLTKVSSVMVLTLYLIYILLYKIMHIDYQKNKHYSHIFLRSFLKIFYYKKKYASHYQDVNNANFFHSILGIQILYPLLKLNLVISDE